MALERGVHSVLVTPFAPDESIDEASVGTLIDSCATAGVAGVLVLGVLGEADRLSDAERERMIAISLAHAAGRIQVTVGVTHASTRVTLERALSAERACADAVMASSPPGVAPSREHFDRVRGALTIPLVVQDYPVSSGVGLPVEFLASLGDVVVKLEDPPTPPKIAALHALAPNMSIFGGLGGLSLLHELDAGSDGTMTGFAFPEALVEIVEAHRSGDRDHGRAAYERWLPLMVLEAQSGSAAVSLRKEILRRRGAIAHATVRGPAAPVAETTLAALDDLLAAAHA